MADCRRHLEALGRRPRAGEQVPTGGAAGAPHDAGCSGEALRLLRRHGLQRRSEFLACKDHRWSGLRGLGHSLAAEMWFRVKSRVGPFFAPPQPSLAARQAAIWHS